MKVGILETGRIPDELAEKHGDYPAMFRRLLGAAEPSLEFTVYHVTEGQLPRGINECDAWLITGSRHGVYDPLPWIEPLKGFLKQAYEAGVPIVGICFGHQILAEALGGRAVKSEKGWGVGVHRYNIHRKPRWMTGVDGEFALNALHQDQVIELPPEAEVVAGSEFCPYSVLAYHGNAISIQPHPEFLMKFLRELIEYRRSTSFPDSVADAGLATLGAPIQADQVAHWIVNFLEERIGSQLASTSQTGTSMNSNPRTEELQQRDSAHHWHPFTDTKKLAARGPRVITGAKGVYLVDSEGHRLLDGMAGLWCVNLGYGRPELVEAARRQMQELPYYNTFFQTSHPPVIELSAALSRLTPGDLNRFFFTGSGSEANDTVVRLVRTYWDVLGKPDKKTIIARVNAYHGSTVAAASLGGMKAMHAQSGLPIPDIVHIAQPYWFDEGGGLSPEEFGRQAAAALAEEIDRLGEDRVAAFIAEPVQGAGGVIVPPDTYWPEVKRICAERDILFVADEVICGFGRLGHWFGSQYYGLQPDLMSMAKGITSGYLPLGAVAIGERVAEPLIEGAGEFFHGYTYSGHPTCAAVAVENLRILQEENIVQRVHEHTAGYFQQAWATLSDHPLVGEARSVGLMGALELVPDKPSRRRFEEVGKAGEICRDLCLENGLVMRAVRDSMIVSPPLVITEAQIDELVDRSRRSLDQAADELMRP